VRGCAGRQAPVTTMKESTQKVGGREPVVLSAMDRRIERRLITPVRAALGIAALVLLALSVFAYPRQGTGRISTVTGERITVSEVHYASFGEYIPLTGNIVPRTTVYLDAVEGGQVTSVLVEEGEIVSAGQALLQLKNTNLQLQVIAAEAQLTEQLNFLAQTSLTAEQTRLGNRRELIECEYQIARLARELTRRRPLLDTGGASQGEIDDLEAEIGYRRSTRTALLDAQRIDDEFRVTQIAQMRTALDALNRSLAIARENLDNLVMTAPISGQLTLFEAKVGESKAIGERIGQVDDQSVFKVSAFVDEFYLPRVSLGQPATYEAGGRAHLLEVVKIYPDVRNRQFQVDLQFLGDAPELVRRGQTLQMRLDIGQPEAALIVANGGFYEDTGGQWAFVLSESGDYAEKRSVRFGRRNPEGIEVLEGLQQGQRVITSSYGDFSDDDRIWLRAAGS
jgi:HlyD family secretion protein